MIPLCYSEEKVVELSFLVKILISNDVKSIYDISLYVNWNLIWTRVVNQMINPEIQQQYHTITMQNKEYWLVLEDHLCWFTTTFLLKLFNLLDCVLLPTQYYMNATLGNY